MSLLTTTGHATHKSLRTSTVLLSAAIAAAVTFVPLAGPGLPVAKAQAQTISINVQFRSALEPHGRWVRHQRWGEVWIPARRDRDWRPYTVGHWVYTSEWGWFWVSDEDFGWVTYHYGRWLPDRQYGWVWIPGNEWGPAWVQWRRGDRYAGWAPLPPRDVFYDYDDDPDFWIFVSFNNFTSRNLARVLAPRRERVVYIRETVIVNRTIIVDGDRDRRSRVAVNPGIEPSIVAARVGRPVQVVEVRPPVVAGTVGVSGAVEVRADERKGTRQRVEVQVTEKKETIEATKDVPAPKPLAKGEEGRLGDRPPEAAKAQVQQTQPDAAKGRQPDAAKAPPDATKGPDTSKGTTDAAKGQPDAARAKPDDAAKPETKGAKTPQPDVKGEPKSQAKDLGEKGKQPAADAKAPEPKQVTPKAMPEPKQAAPKAPEPKQLSAPKAPPEPKQAAPKAPEPKQQQATPKATPEPKQQAAPKAPEPRQQAAPKSAPAQQAAPQAPPPQAAPKAPAKKGAPKEKDEEKGKGG